MRKGQASQSVSMLSGLPAGKIYLCENILEISSWQWVYICYEKRVFGIKVP